MKFGLFGGAVRPLEGTSTDKADYTKYIDYVVEAETLGFHTAFVAEHHFTGFGQVGAVLTLIAHMAARTSTIRLGTAVIVVPWHHPVLLAEQIATVDVISDGRLDLGIGRGYRPNEFHGFGADPSEADERFIEGVEVLKKIWAADGRFSHEGKYWKFQDALVEPSPLQEPHPPVWVGAGSEGSIRRAAREGNRLLVDQFGTIDVTCQRIEWYRDEIEKNGGTFDPAHVTAARDLMLLRDEDILTLDEEIDIRLAAIARTRESSKIPGQSRELTVEDHAFYDATRANSQDAVIGGSAEECIQRLKILESAGAGQVIFLARGGLPRLRHFAEAVMPAFS